MLAASLGASRSIMAGPFESGDTDGGHLVPADKRLDAAWVHRLFERGEKEVYRGRDLETIAMPCGGIGAGQLYLCGDGTLGCWQIHNNARSNWVGDTHSTYEHKGIDRPVDQGFTLSVKTGRRVTRKSLNKEGFADVAFQGEYPIALIRYAEEGFPVRVEMEAFSPFIPLNARDSGLPATVFHITVDNVSPQRATVQLLGRLQNAVGIEYRTQFPAIGRTRVRHDKDRAVVVHSAEEPPPETEEAPPPARPAVLFESFEGTDYGSWRVEGEAFGTGPARGAFPGQQPVSGYEGEGLVNSFLGGDTPRGKLTSPEFVVDRRYINFLVGGGSQPGKTCVNLLIDGAVARTATGRDTERLDWHAWDVGPFEGKTARIEIVDDSSGGWGHINVDHIEFADAPRSGGIVPLRKARDFGTMALLCVDPAAPTALEATLAPADAPESYVLDGDVAYDLSSERIGVLGTRAVSLAPGKKHTFTFVMAWHFPNQAHGHAYAARFDDAAAVAEFVREDMARLTADTRLWRDTYYDSTLPYWLLDRLHSTVSYLATGTCQWWKNGRFYAYEGVTCCEGTCTHVWNYAHAHARLFPELARSVREMQDFAPRGEGGGFDPETGLVGFRGNDAYAADGQCGTILKAYREHLTSPDDAFLRGNWPRIKKALEYSIGRDANADGLIEDEQHNTYDINYYGPNTFVGALYLAALRAGREMALEVGDLEFAERAGRIFESGAALTLARLWNGEYFVQDVDLAAHPHHQYKDGCLSDHLFGQGWAHQVALGYLYPPDHVRTALDSIWKYNWAPDIAPYNEAYKPFRWFITPGQAGLLTCTWPKSDYLPNGTLYKDEVWTGIEYQVAGHMVWEGMLTEAFVMCRAVHDRYHPALRNPYNEVECGDHYARAMASWGVFLALAGFEYHGPRGHIGFAPRIAPERFRAAFTAAEGWGTFAQERDGETQAAHIEVRWGRLRARSMAFAVPGVWPRAWVEVTKDGIEFPARCRMDAQGRVTIELEQELVLAAGERLDVRFERRA